MIEQAIRPGALTPFFRPDGVAVIGASADPSKLSHAVLGNLLDPASRYPGPVYPVNPTEDEILGLRCYADVSAVPDPVELAVIVIPAPHIPDVVEACGRRGVKALVIISGGFREVGDEGAERERQVVEIARRYGMRVMGPNCIGVIDTSTPLNTTFVRGMPAAGHIAFVSQSGALCGGVIDWALDRGIGFSRLLSVGNKADTTEVDLLPSLVDDEQTRVIALYLEDVKDGQGFIEASRMAAAHKPVLAIKAGRTSSGQAATASHTGALAGAHTAFRAACRQTGVIECDTVKALFDGAVALSYQPPLRGGRVAILTNAGGLAALAADAMEPIGLTLARSSPAAQRALREILPPAAQVAGPVDMLGSAGVSNYGAALDTLLGDEENDGVLVMLAPQALVDAVTVVQTIAGVSRRHKERKPVVLCLMGESSLTTAYIAAHRLKLPPYTFPEEAVAALGVLYQRARWLASPRSAPVRPTGMDVEKARSLITSALASGSPTIDAFEGQDILSAIGVPIPRSELATSAREAATIASRIGFPVVLKLVSPDMTHKTDVGGVLVGVEGEANVEAAFHTLMQRAQAANPKATIRGVQVQEMVRGGQEVIVGVKRDPTFGPLVMFGMGGVYAEALADVSFRLAPLSKEDAGDMIAEVRAARILRGLRGNLSADREALADTILRVGWLAHECPEIGEWDINPLMVLPEGHGVCALDIRMALG